MTEAHEAVLKVAAILAALAVLWLIHHPRWFGLERRRAWWGLVALGALGYINFGGFHTDGTPFHLWDQFHYVTGSKYFPELGYDGIYVAALAAREEIDPAYVPPARIRDLRTNQIVATQSLNDFQRQVRARFTDSRWISFRADVTHFYLRDEVFLDHGYNPPPAHVAVERLFTRWLPFRQLTLALYAMFDFVLLVVAGCVIHRVFGLETLAAASLVFGLGYCSRYYWVGGAFLRQDMLVALILCAAALARGRMRWAGAALAYASCARVFPVVMLVPLVIYAISQWRQERAHAARFAVGFAVCAAMLVALGCFTGRGPAAWSESAQRLLVHASMVPPNAIGLQVPFGASLANLRGELVNPATLYDYARIAADYATMEHEHRLLAALAIWALLLFWLRVVWNCRDATTAFIAGTVAVFVVTTPVAYYGSYFVLLVLVRPSRSATALLIANLSMYAVAGMVLLLAQRRVIILNGAAVYVPVSLLLLAVSLDWLRGVSRNPAAVANWARAGANS
jgi:hypothetical protein